MGWNEGQSLGCIYTALGNIDFAYEILCDYIEWFQKTFPMNITPKDKSWELLNNGFLYIYGRDHQFRPIIVCQPYILQNKMDYFSNTDVVNVCLFVCQFAVNNLLIPGQIENWIMFFNLKGTSLLSLPEPIKNLVQELSDNFNFRLFKVYVLGMSFLMRILYRFVSSFIGQPDEEKIVILEGRKDKHLFEDFTPENLEKKFGGTAENVIYGNDNLFPPRMPTKNVFFPWEDKNKILISEDEYIIRCKNGLIPFESISPYLFEQIFEKKENKDNKEINANNKEINKINIIETENKIKNDINEKHIITNKYNVYNFNKIKKNNALEIKNFLNSIDWGVKEELINNKKYYSKFSSDSFNKSIKSFIQKKERFIQGITKFG